MTQTALKLHLGCGTRFIPGYLHIDSASFDHVDRVGDISDLSFLSDKSADVIYCCHAFEYFDRQQASEVLREWHRVLRPGAVLRLAVPDFAALAELYRMTGSLDRLVGPLYGRMPSGNTAIYHRTVYDFQSLERLLLDSGFSQVRRYDWRCTDHASIDDFSQAYYPHLDKENGLLISLNVEATRA